MFLSLATVASQSLTLTLAPISIFNPYPPTYRKVKRYAAMYKHIRNSIMKRQTYHSPCCSVTYDGTPHQLALFLTFSNKWKI
jgi:hypothetical protein